MPDSARDLEGGREPHHDADQSPSSSGFTRFLVDGPSSAGISRERLIEAVRCLVRERDYLRNSRDMALADFRLEATTQKEHAEAWRAQVETLKCDLAALQGEVENLHRERTEIFADRQAVYEDRKEIREDRDAIRADRDALLADRDAWRARATRSLSERVRRTLPNFTGGWLRSSRNTDKER